MSHNHKHQHKDISSQKIFIVVILNFIITISEIVGGILSRSLSLLSDSLHNLSDTFSILLSYFAIKISKKPNDIKRTFGYKRSEIIVAFVNSSTLVVIAIWLIIEAIKRFYKPEIIDSNLMIVIATIGFFGNLISIIMLNKESKNNLNIKSSFLHLVGDTVSSIGVIIGAVLIKFFNIYFIDPILTILISLYILKEAIEIILKTINILMQASPDIDFEEIKKKIELINGVKNIHHIHCWMINENTIHFEAHVDIENMLISDVEKIYCEIENIMKNDYNIEHVTIQPEINKCCNKDLIKKEGEKNE
ncbi:MAG TPA: cation diffusion facilitator family transporter [Spirochaetota bacterium]|nr:cation diffusion facilitator family transporter [Spirochaetota bacterium]